MLTVLNKDEVPVVRPLSWGDENYAQPDTPIRVVLARDEELSHRSEPSEFDEEVDLAPPPPAYGLWRSSVVSITGFTKDVDTSS